MVTAAIVIPARTPADSGLALAVSLILMAPLYSRFAVEETEAQHPRPLTRIRRQGLDMGVTHTRPISEPASQAVRTGSVPLILQHPFV